MTQEERSAAVEGLSRRQAALRQRSGEHTVAVFTLDADGRVASWNPDAERVAGYRSEDICGRHFSVFYPPEDVAAGYPDAELARAAEVGVHLDEGWRVRQDGRWIWAYIVIAAQHSEQGHIQGFTKVVRDETENHLRHQRSDQRFSDLLTLAPMGVGLFDEHDRIREVNAELCRLTDYSRQQLLALAASDLLPADERSHGIRPQAGSAHESPDPGVGRSSASTGCRTCVRLRGRPRISTLCAVLTRTTRTPVRGRVCPRGPAPTPPHPAGAG